MDKKNVINAHSGLLCAAREREGILTSAATWVNLDIRLKKEADTKSKVSHSHEKEDQENLNRKKVG